MSQFLTYLDSVAAPIAEMTGLDPAAVIVWSQQEIDGMIDKAIYKSRCAITIAATGISLTGKIDERVSPPLVALDIIIRVFTPEVILDEEGKRGLAVAESIILGFHGRKPPEGSNGNFLIPAFEGASTAVVSEGQGKPKYAVIDLAFKVKFALNNNLQNN